MNTKLECYAFAWALANVLDGLNVHDIAEKTGMSDDDCELVNEIRNIAVSHVLTTEWEKPIWRPEHNA